MYSGLKNRNERRRSDCPGTVVCTCNGRENYCFLLSQKRINSFADNCGKNISWSNKIYWFLSLDPRFWFKYLLSGWKSYRDFRETVPRLFGEKKKPKNGEPGVYKSKISERSTPSKSRLRAISYFSLQGYSTRIKHSTWAVSSEAVSRDNEGVRVSSRPNPLL